MPARRSWRITAATWRKWFKPRMQRIIESARAVKSELPVFYRYDAGLIFGPNRGQTA